MSKNTEVDKSEQTHIHCPYCDKKFFTATAVVNIMYGGKTYYLQVRTFSTGTGTCSLNVTKMEITGYCYALNILGYFKDITLEAGNACYFRFTAPETNSYTFTTKYSSGYKDLYMVILDDISI